MRVGITGHSNLTVESALLVADGPPGMLVEILVPAPSLGIHRVPVKQCQAQQGQPHVLLVWCLFGCGDYLLQSLPQHSMPHLVHVAHRS